ncbi:putative damage-inducible protein DinB [Pedobacter sp. UYP30]|uniref:DinB family protein n=1 Tax=Pedobacter sp. UYP30 TaxID=1756400 RepID=UPI00339AA613
MLNITNELKKAFDGDAWHGRHALQILENVKPAKAFSHFIPTAHSIAEIALHLTAWTEEVSARLMGKVASEPTNGDWQTTLGTTESAWAKIIFDFKIANEELIRICEGFKEKDWNNLVNEEQRPILAVNFTELVNGLIQHHAYHAGQIALLSKF